MMLRPTGNPPDIYGPRLVVGPICLALWLVLCVVSARAQVAEVAPDYLPEAPLEDFFYETSPQRGVAPTSTTAAGPLPPPGRADWVKDLPARKETVYEDGLFGYENYRLPALVPNASGALLAFCEARRDHRNDTGDIDLVLRRSTDGGRSWGPVQLVHEEGGRRPITIGNPCPILDRRSGDIVLLFCRNNRDVFLTRSGDGGLTWAVPRNITDRAKLPHWTYYATGPGHGIQTATGRLIAPCVHRDPARRWRRSHVLLSDDGGHNWRIGGVAGAPSKECALVETASGTLYLNMRSPDIEFRRVAWSLDDGESWTPPEIDRRLIEPGCHASVVLANDSESNPVFVFSNPASQRRQELTIRMSRDGCATWSPGKVLHLGHAGFSDLTALERGHAGCLYEADRYCRIVYARFALRDAAHSPLYDELARRSYPGSLERVSLMNPWGEDLPTTTALPANFAERILTAAAVYNDQRIRFDGYVGSSDDGRHYQAAADGKDAAWLGDSGSGSYYAVRDGIADDVRERLWICLDYPIHVLELAGFPIRRAMEADFHRAPGQYTFGGTFRQAPTTHWFFRRIPNFRLYMKRKQFYREVRITRAQYRDPSFRPGEPLRPGDLLLFGHYGDGDGLGHWFPKHSGIVATVDSRGLPDLVYNMRVSHKLIDAIDGRIDQTRRINGWEVYFERFLDRYSLLAVARIVHPFDPRRPVNPEAVRRAGRSRSRRKRSGQEETPPGLDAKVGTF